MCEKVIIIGCGGHGKVIAEIIKKSGDNVLGYLDDRYPNVAENDTVLGKISDIEKYKVSTKFIVAIGNNEIRKKIMETYQVQWHTAIHPSAVVSDDVDISIGSVIMANGVVNSGSRIGSGVIVNTASTIDHESVVEDYVHISPGVHIAGNVRIGECTWIGIGASVINNIDICGYCMIGAGAVVVKDIDISGMYFGVPAKLKGD